jgi:hypothetical protein
MTNTSVRALGTPALAQEMEEKGILHGIQMSVRKGKAKATKKRRAKR